jgi:hypothetical protein
MDDHLSDPAFDAADAERIAFARAHWANIRLTIPDAQFLSIAFIAELLANGRLTKKDLEREIRPDDPADAVSVWSDAHTGICTLFVHSGRPPRPRRRKNAR